MAGGASSAFYLRLHQEANRATESGLASFPRPERQQRLLVLAPHCDDETLGVGALIADARRRGVHVTVAFLTNGDGFEIAAQREMRDVAVNGAEMIRFAQKRQAEALKAMHLLGVEPSDVVFLGYPDRGLKALWEKNWERNNPFRSPFTACDHSPYAQAFSPKTPYSGSALLSDLERLMRSVRPTDVFVTHPADDHPDHHTAAAFTQAALQSCADHLGVAGDGAWAESVKVHYYLIHRGDWPIPQGAHPDRPLLPPNGLATTDTNWRSYVPSADALAAKRRALEAYRSQTAVMGRFLRSFVRENEMFGEMEAAHVAGRTPATVLDARRDDLVRYLDPATDVSAMSVSRTEDGKALRVFVTLRGPVSKRVRYSLLLRASAPPLSDADERGLSAPPMLHTSLPVRAVGARVLQTTVPLSTLGDEPPRCVWIAAETRWRGTGRWRNLPPLDRFGYRPFLLNF